MPHDRRLWLRTLAAGFIAGSFAPSRAGFARRAERTADPFAPFDRMLEEFLTETEAPGVALAVGRDGAVVHERGFGVEDTETGAPITAASRFRIASVSKPLTAVALLRLVERGRLSLDDSVVERMGLDPHLEPGATLDDRWKRITIRHCLNHTGGWDRDAGFDPAFIPARICKSLGIDSPPRPNDIVRYMLGQPLDFDPGAKYAYSNLGYLVLGRIIEQATGLPYETAVRDDLLAPLGIRSMQLGRALPEHRAPHEVRYHDPHDRRGPCLYPPRVGENVPGCYGADNLEGFAAHGGWIATAGDLVRFALAFTNPDRSPRLKPDTIRAMWARPDGPPGLAADGALKPTYYGLGWMVRPAGPAKTDSTSVNAWHTGRISGTEALLVRRHDGLCWAVLFNSHHRDRAKRLSGVIDPRLHTSADAWLARAN